MVLVVLVVIRAFLSYLPSSVRPTIPTKPPNLLRRNTRKSTKLQSIKSKLLASSSTSSAISSSLHHIPIKTLLEAFTIEDKINKKADLDLQYKKHLKILFRIEKSSFKVFTDVEKESIFETYR